MKKHFFLLLCTALSLCACQKAPAPEKYEDSSLTGTHVSPVTFSSSIQKVFILNEGCMGSNNATLDFIRVTDGTYVSSAFKKMNPSVGAGLGDVANDIAVKGDEVWIVVNNSGIVEVISAKDEKEIAAITIPTPRHIAFDDNYAYVTSWADAYVTGEYDDEGNYRMTDYSNPNGQVFRINLSTKKVEGSVQTGYQPEGIAFSDGKLYVANSGGISGTVPPNYSYDNRVTVIDTDSFKASGTIEAGINLKYVYAASDGSIYVTSYGNYYDIHSALYILENGSARKISDYVEISALSGDTVYCIGTETEFDWGAASHEYMGFKVSGGVKSDWSLPVDAVTPYSLYAVDGDSFLLGDSGNRFDPGTVTFYSGGKKRWSVTAGVCPGHYAIW